MQYNLITTCPEYQKLQYIISHIYIILSNL